LPGGEDVPPGQLATAFAERIKELNCLYAVSQLIEREDVTLETLLSAVVDVLPPSWQHPDVACARIVFGARRYESLYFADSDWRITAQIICQGVATGEVAVHYTEARPEADEGPFLTEERHLIEAIAERIGHFASRKIAESRLDEYTQRLAADRTALREANATMRSVLDRIEEEKAEIQRDILENVDSILMPIVQTLAMEVPTDQSPLVALLEENLQRIASPFARRLSHDFQSLTPTEIRICDMIRSGMSSKEIARLRGVTTATISRHREHIRKKLGLTNTKANLTTYLQGHS
jgi:DNA-binding CsgD family transcriptional regulator